MSNSETIINIYDILQSYFRVLLQDIIRFYYHILHTKNLYFGWTSLFSNILVIILMYKFLFVIKDEISYIRYYLYLTIK